MTLCLTFQFTHPGKGATGAYHRGALPVDVSIHAPWEGCDSSGLQPQALGRRFQFTHPGKGATQKLFGINKPNTFQFTHPGKGATGRTRQSSTSPSSFNSRTLGRVRPLWVVLIESRKGFQFTHPGKGATGLPHLKDTAMYNVSIHAPWEGCDSIRQHDQT